MLGFLFFCFLFAGIGVFAIYRGKSAVKNKYMANSLKSTLVTGITHVKGDAAVKTGKITIVIGWIIVGMSSTVAALGVILWLALMVERMLS